MLLLRYAAALALTLAVEVPVYAVMLVTGWRVPWRRAVALAVAANLATHPPLWWLLLPLTANPSYGWILLGAEAAVCLAEWLLLVVSLRRRDPLLLAPSVAANATSVLAGIGAAGIIGSVG
jgi:hypothetical protein